MLSLPVTTPEPINIVPPSVVNGTAGINVVLEPRTVALVIVLFVASFANLIVEVPATDDVLKLEIVNALPAVFKPSIVTLSAPLKFKRAPTTLPETVLAAPPLGWILIVKPLPLISYNWFKATAPSSSIISLITLTVRLPVKPPVFKALNNPSAFVNEVKFPAVPTVTVPPETGTDTLNELEETAVKVPEVNEIVAAVNAAEVAVRLVKVAVPAIAGITEVPPIVQAPVPTFAVIDAVLAVKLPYWSWIDITGWVTNNPPLDRGEVAWVLTANLLSTPTPTAWLTMASL